MSLLIPPLIIVKLSPTFLTMLYIVYLILTSNLLFFNKFLLFFVIFLLLRQTKNISPYKEMLYSFNHYF
jgi:hypothetical protein